MHYRNIYMENHIFCIRFLNELKHRTTILRDATLTVYIFGKCKKSSYVV